MTREEALKLRSRSINGENVTQDEWMEAMAVIRATGGHPGRPCNFRLPNQTRAERDRANGVLLLNLGMAMRRAAP